LDFDSFTEQEALMTEERKRLYYFYQFITAGAMLIISGFVMVASPFKASLVLLVGLLISIPISLVAAFLVDGVPQIGASLLYGGLPDPESRGSIVLQDDLHKAEQWLREGNPDQGLAMLRDLLTTNPEHPEVRFRLASMYESLGHQRPAMTHYLRLQQHAKGLRPNNMYLRECKSAIERIRKELRQPQVGPAQLPTVT
jgi:hypothetical protein